MRARDFTHRSGISREIDVEEERRQREREREREAEGARSKGAAVRYEDVRFEMYDLQP